MTEAQQSQEQRSQRRAPERPVTITGRVASEPRFAVTSKGTSVANFSLAEPAFKAGPNGKPVEDRTKTKFWEVTAWRDLGEEAGNKLHKGNQITVEGNHDPDRRYEQNGEERTRDNQLTASEISVGLDQVNEMRTYERQQQQTQDQGMSAGL